MSTERLSPLSENHQGTGLGKTLRNLAFTIFTTSHPWGVDHLGIPIYYPEDYHPEDPGMDAFTQPIQQAEQPAIIASRRPRQRRGMLSLPRLAGAAAIAAAVAFLPGIMNSKAESPAAAEPAPTPIPATAIAIRTPEPTYTVNPQSAGGSIPAEASVTATPPPPEPTKSVEAKQPKEEWEKYFELVSADQARAMLEAEKAKGTPRFLFPQFDVKGVTKDFEWTMRKTRVVGLLIKGLALNTTVRSNYDGNARPSAIGSQPLATEIVGKPNTDNGVAYILRIPRVAGPNNIPLGEFQSPTEQGYPVALGATMDVLKTKDTLSEKDFPGGWQVSFFIRRQKPDGDYDFAEAEPGNILTTASGKIVMLQP